MLENLLEYYRKSEGVTKKKIIGCIFAEKTVFKHRAQSTGLSVIETALPQDSKTARQQDKKTKEVSVSARAHLRQGYGGRSE